jgi:hypothetical protein
MNGTTPNTGVLLPKKSSWSIQYSYPIAVFAIQLISFTANIVMASDGITAMIGIILPAL